MFIENLCVLTMKTISKNAKRFSRYAQKMETWFREWMYLFFIYFFFYKTNCFAEVWFCILSTEHVHNLDTFNAG